MTTCHVTVALNLANGSLSLEFAGPVTYNAARKGWDGCIYGPDRPKKNPPQNSRVIVMPPVAPGQPRLTNLFLSATGYAEVAFAEPSLTAKEKPYRDGHVTLMKAYDDGGSMRFAPFADGGGVQVDLGHAASFDLGLTKFETNTLAGEELLTRTIGPISGLTNVIPPYLDALLLKKNGGSVECSADFNNLGSPTVHVLVYNNGALVAERTGVTGQLGQPVLLLPTWPNQLSKLGGSTPCRRGKLPPGFIILPGNSSGVPPQTVTGDEFRILAELSPAAPHPDFYSGFEFIASADTDWGVTNLTTTSICVAQPVAIARSTGGVSVSWTGTTFRLQGAENVTGPWYDLGAASPVSVPASSTARFFRLVCD